MSYGGASGVVYKYPPGHSGIDPSFDLRPQVLWERRFFGKKTWSDEFDASGPGFPEAVRLSVSRDGDRVVVERFFPGNTVLRIVADLQQGGNVIEFTAGPVDGDVKRAGKYAWQRDAGGNWYLQNLRFWRARDGELQEPFYEADVTSFDPQWPIPSNRFEASSFGLPEGTLVYEFDHEGRTRHRQAIGRAADPPATDNRRDERARELRSRGYASPERANQ